MGIFTGNKNLQGQVQLEVSEIIETSFNIMNKDDESDLDFVVTAIFATKKALDYHGGVSYNSLSKTITSIYDMYLQEERRSEAIKRCVILYQCFQMAKKRIKNEEMATVEWFILYNRVLAREKLIERIYETSDEIIKDKDSLKSVACRADLFACESILNQKKFIDDKVANWLKSQIKEMIKDDDREKIIFMSQSKSAAYSEYSNLEASIFIQMWEFLYEHSYSSRPIDLSVIPF